MTSTGLTRKSVIGFRLTAVPPDSHFQATRVLADFGFLAAALPPDVRRGYASPLHLPAVPPDSHFQATRVLADFGFLAAAVPPDSHFQATRVLADFGFLAAALPPDVRRGYASPLHLDFRMGCAPGSSFARESCRPKAKPGAQPQTFVGISTARHSLASHPAAEPGRGNQNPAAEPRRRGFLRRAALLVMTVLITNGLCAGQTENLPPVATKPTTTKTLPADERAELLKIIRTLEERVEKLEAAQAPASRPAPATASSSPAPASQQASTDKPDPSSSDDPHVWMAPVVKDKPASEADDSDSYGRYTPNLGYKLANTEHGDLSISIYTYARYLNQLGLKSDYTDSFGNTKNVQERQDFQLQKVQIKMLGWVLDPKFRYFLYTWTSNPTQGQGAQVVVAGNTAYTFNEHFTLAAGITSLPGVRSTEGNFPFWLSVDSRHIADEFFRPSYTSGVWLKGNITKHVRYQVMLGNNLSTLGVSAARLDNKFNTLSTAVVWVPTGEYGQGWGDFENHRKATSRFGIHFTRSDENRESQPNNETFENTQLRLSDGTVIFTPELFGPGITITDARYQMLSLDGGLKYRGYALEGEYYFRWLNNFRGENTEGLPRLFDHGFQLQASAMAIPKTLQLYAGISRINGEFGNPFDIRSGVNWFPWKNKVVRWNTEWLYLRNSPVGYSSVPFVVGAKGNVFHSSLELAF